MRLGLPVAWHAVQKLRKNPSPQWVQVTSGSPVSQSASVSVSVSASGVPVSSAVSVEAGSGLASM